MQSDKRWEIVVGILGTLIVGLLTYIAIGAYQLRDELAGVREAVAGLKAGYTRVDDLSSRTTKVEERVNVIEQRVAKIEGGQP